MQCNVIGVSWSRHRHHRSKWLVGGRSLGSRPLLDTRKMSYAYSYTYYTAILIQWRVRWHNLHKNTPIRSKKYVPYGIHTDDCMINCDLILEERLWIVHKLSVIIIHRYRNCITCKTCWHSLHDNITVNNTYELFQWSANCRQDSNLVVCPTVRGWATYYFLINRSRCLWWITTLPPPIKPYLQPTPLLITVGGGHWWLE